MTVKKKMILVTGAGGYGHHLVKRLVADGYYVRGVDVKFPEFEPAVAQDFIDGALYTRRH